MFFHSRHRRVLFLRNEESRVKELPFLTMSVRFLRVMFVIDIEEYVISNVRLRLDMVVPSMSMDRAFNVPRPFVAMISESCSTMTSQRTHTPGVDPLAGS